MTVQFSCRCPNADYLGFEAAPEAIIATAVKAEALGFDAVFVNDHIIVDGSPRSDPWTDTYDPLIALSFITANTTRIGLGVSVLIVPYRNPVATAKALAKIDRISGGRLIAVLGSGGTRLNSMPSGCRFASEAHARQSICGSGELAGRRVSSRLTESSFPSRICTSTRSHCGSRPFWVGGVTTKH